MKSLKNRFRARSTVITLFLAPGSVLLKWLLKKMEFDKGLFFSELLDWIVFIFPKSNLHKVGIKAIDRFFLSEQPQPPLRGRNQNVDKKAAFCAV